MSSVADFSGGKSMSRKMLLELVWDSTSAEEVMPPMIGLRRDSRNTGVRVHQAQMVIPG